MSSRRPASRTSAAWACRTIGERRTSLDGDRDALGEAGDQRQAGPAARASNARATGSPGADRREHAAQVVRELAAAAAYDAVERGDRALALLRRRARGARPRSGTPGGSAVRGPTPGWSGSCRAPSTPSTNAAAHSSSDDVRLPGSDSARSRLQTATTAKAASPHSTCSMRSSWTVLSNPARSSRRRTDVAPPSTRSTIVGRPAQRRPEDTGGGRHRGRGRGLQGRASARPGAGLARRAAPGRPAAAGPRAGRGSARGPRPGPRPCRGRRPTSPGS